MSKIGTQMLLASMLGLAAGASMDIDSGRNFGYAPKSSSFKNPTKKRPTKASKKAKRKMTKASKKKNRGK